MTRRIGPWVAAVAVWGLASGCWSAPRDRRDEAVLVFAAVSLRTVLDAVTPAIERDTGVTVRVSYAASAALARQVEAGAPAGVFVSADTRWMDYLQSRGHVIPGSRVNLAGNRLVLIAPRGRLPALRIGPGFPLRAALGDGRLALGEPSSVPAGTYAREALSRLGVWAEVEDRLAAVEHVRAALLLVSRGETPLGVVYRTDALQERGVVVVDTFPASSHQPIVYPAARIAGAARVAQRVLDHLAGPAARRVFEQHGFLPPP